MSKLTDADILKLARLSRISLNDQELPRYKKEIESILDYVKKLQSVKLTGLQPTAQVGGQKNVVRDDKIIDYGYKPKDLLKGAPATMDGHIKVKRMLQ